MHSPAMYEIAAQLQSRIVDPYVSFNDRVEAKRSMLAVITMFAVVGLPDIQRHLLTARLQVRAMESWDTPARLAVDLLAVVSSSRSAHRD